jgi:hypothetical protein
MIPLQIAPNQAPRLKTLTAHSLLRLLRLTSKWHQSRKGYKYSSAAMSCLLYSTAGISAGEAFRPEQKRAVGNVHFT